MSESVILCEGYHDRAFWAGWLKYLQCTDPGIPPPGKTRRPEVRDPWNIKVAGGQYAYWSKTRQFIRILPCQGRSQILPEAENRLLQRASKPLRRLVINVDPDVSASGPPAGVSGLRRHDVEHFVRSFDPAATPSPGGEIEMDGGATKVALMRWEANDPPAPGLPNQQTLERLVCAALIAAYPARAKPVHDWLNSRPQPPSEDPKEHAWSFMAGWYAGFGCEAFYSHLWNDPPIVRELEARLRAAGAWQVVDDLAS